MSSRQIIFFIPLAAFLGLVIYLWNGLQIDPRIIPSALIDQPVPDFSLPPLETGKLGMTSSDLSGQVSILNIFASWCLPCRTEHPQLMHLADKDIVAVYGINWKDNPVDAVGWLKKFGNPYSQIGNDPQNTVGIELGVYGVPETYVIDAEGRIRYKHIGPVLPDTLNNTIIPLIRELRE